MYGPVRPLSETFRILGLVKPSSAPVAEKKVDSDREKAEKRRVIEEARRARQEKMQSKAQPKELTKEAASKSRLETLLEEVERAAKELRGESAVPAAGKSADEILASLKHVLNFSSKVVKKFEWREDERSKNIASLFKVLGEEATRLAAAISDKKLSEGDTESVEAYKLIKRYVEAVECMRAYFKVNEDAVRQIKEQLKDVE